ncbi:MAG: ATP-binding protein [Acidimicrobiia bacterium]|nr:ATP-binding protein [Acidimicrobiia bacterium]
MSDLRNTLTMPGYLMRVAGSAVESALRRRGSVLIEGVRGCGKTWLARYFARSEVRLDNEAVLLLASSDPVEVLQGPVPRLLDEWQNAPKLWNWVRRECDDRPERGQFILTGSAVPQDDVTRHTGTGRISRVLLRPMSLFEAGRSTGDVSLRAVFEGDAVSSMPNERVGLREIASAICAGGWPQNLDESDGDAFQSVRDYVGEVVRVDLLSGSGVRHDPDMVRRFMLALSYSISTEAKITKLASDVRIGNPPGRNTVAAYLDALRRIFVVEDQPAWPVSLRSKAVLRREAKRHFVDPSLAAALVGSTPERLLADHTMFGMLFESLVVRDLRVYSQSDLGGVFHFRDNTGLEADAIVERVDGSWIAAEIKLNTASSVIDRAAKTLKRL